MRTEFSQWKRLPWEGKSVPLQARQGTKMRQTALGILSLWKWRNKPIPQGKGGGQTVWALVGNTYQNLRALFSSHVHFAHRTLRQLVINQNYWIICTCCKCLYQWVSPLLILTGDRTAMLCESKKGWGCHMLSITNSYQPIKILHSPQQPLWLASIGKSHDTVTHDTVKVTLGFLVSCLRTQIWTETSAFSQSVLSSFFFFLKRIPCWGERLVRDYFYTAC